MKKLLSMVLVLAMIFNSFIVFAQSASVFASASGIDVSISDDSTERNVKVNSSGAISDVSLYVAAYDGDGKMVGVVVRDNLNLVKGENAFEVEPTWASSDREYSKIFLWDNNNSPLTEQKTVYPPTIMVETVHADIADGTAKVDISIENNPGISSLKFDVTYDEELVLTGVEYNDNFGYVTAPEPFENPQTISFISPFGEVDLNETFATLVFDISGVSEGTECADIYITCDAENTFDEENTPVVFDIVNGKIEFDNDASAQTASLMSLTDPITLSVTEKTAVIGKTVDVDIVLTGNTELSSLKFKVEYDDILTLENVELNKALFGSLLATPSSYSNPQTISLVSPLKEVKANGTIATLTFNVSEEAQDGYEAAVNITYDTDDIFDGDYNNIATIVNNSIVTVYNGLPGDMNADGKVNNWDAILHFQYLADFGVEIDANALDANGDEKVNNKDSVEIFRYVAGWSGIVLKRGKVCNHVLEKIEAVAATCTEPGNIEYWHCTADCGNFYSDANAKNKIALEDTVVEAIGHTEVTVPGYAATTEEEGLTDGIKCSVCDEWIIKQDTIPVLSPEKYSLTYYNNGNYNTEEYIKNETLVLSAPESIVGYDFNGWFTKPDGDGEKIELILSGNPDNIQVVYADYVPIEYQITFTNANGYKDEGIEYTIESKDIYLTTNPEWQHLIFMGWNDASGKLKYVNDTPVIKSGTTGDIVLDATWKTKQNMLELPEKEYSNAAFNPDDGMYYFFYHLGNVKNVLLQPKEGTGREHSGNTTTLTTSKTVTVSNSTAKEEASAVSNALRTSFENTFESSVTTELSTTIGASATAGAEVDAGFAKANASATASTEVTAGASWSATIGGSYSEEGETSHTKEFSSTVSYMEESSITQETSITLDSDDPKGWYYFIPAGTFEIYSVVLYDPASKELKFDVFSKHIDTYPFTLYVPYLAEVKVNPEIDSIDYDYFADSIKEKVNNSLFVFYETGHEDVIIDEKNNIISGNYNISSENKLPSCNWYSRDGYVFDGWQVCDNDGNILLEKIEDGAAISELAECCSKENKVFKLRAIWAEKVIVELDQTNVENTNETTSVIYLVPDREKIYKDIECTEEITIDDLVVPERTGYTFCSYYKENVEYISNGRIDSAIYLLTSGDKLSIKWNPNTYMVSFDVNGGSCNVPEAIEVTYDSQYGELPDLKWTGHKFAGWYLDDSPITESSDVKTSRSHTLKARWDCESYLANWTVPTGVTIIVNRTSSPSANASTGTISNGATVFYGDVLSITYTASAGYSISSKGATSITVTGNVTEKDIFAIPTVNSYTASWNTPANVTIVVKRTSSPYAKASIGTLSSGATVYYGDVLSVTYAAATGYSVASKGATSITVTGNVNTNHIYATETANPYTVTYNLNTSSIKTTPTCSSTSKSVTYNSTYGTLPTPTASYYTFDGWYTAASGGTKITSSTTVTTASNHTLYAHWTKTMPEYTYINSVADLKKIGTSGKYALVADISNVGAWTPLPAFSGTLNGNGKTISGMNITIPTSTIKNTTSADQGEYYGLFRANSGTIQNLKFKSCTVSMQSCHEGKGWVYAGVVCGINNGSGSIKNIEIQSSSVTVHRTRSEFGIVSGTNNGIIQLANVLNGCKVYGNGDMGGITGGLCGTVDSCLVDNATIDFYLVSDASVGNNAGASGGAVGYSNNGTIKYTNVTNTRMILESSSINVDDWVGKNGPCQGYVVGHQKGGVIKSIGGGADHGCSATVTNYDFGCGGFLCFSCPHYDNYFNGNQRWGYAGKISDNPAIE